MRTLIYVLAAMLVALSACAAHQPAPQPASVPKTRVVDTSCSWVKPITASPADTLETKQQILAHDLAVAKNCPARSRSATDQQEK